MDARKNRQSLMLGVPGLLLQAAAVFTAANFGEGSLIPPLMLLVGFGLLIAGLGFYAMAKGHSPVWGLLGLLSILGLLVLAFLPDRVSDRR